MSDAEKIVKFPDLGAIEEEAAGWIARLDREGLSAESHAGLREWQNRSTHHREALARLSMLWAELDTLHGLALPGETQPAAGPQIPAPFHRRRFLTYATAASVTMVAAGATAYLARPGGVDLPQSYQTAVGAQKTVSLSDGSSILLNTNSLVEVRFSDARRDVRLTQGEAFFDVAPDRSRPFSVFAGDGIVRAIGTAFAVRLADRDIEVTVTRGNVELASLSTPSSPVSIPAGGSRRKLGTISAGQNAVFDDKVERVASVSAPDLNRKLAWRNGVLAFAGEPLPQVVADISRYTNVKIEIKDRQLDDLRVGGYFQIGQVDAMFEALEDNFGVRVVRVNDSLVRLYAAT